MLTEEKMRVRRTDEVQRAFSAWWRAVAGRCESRFLRVKFTHLTDIVARRRIEILAWIAEVPEAGRDGWVGEQQGCCGDGKIIWLTCKGVQKREINRLQT
jgi:hypothetical protein